MKIFKSLFVIFAMAVLVVGATGAVFSDTETVAGNTFAAGTMDLEVNGENDPVSFSFSGDGLVPGATSNAGTVTLSNAGDLDGELTVEVANPHSGENGTTEAERAAGDIGGQEVDPTGYDQNTGNGELWDMAKIKLYFDVNSDGEMQWNEPVIWGGQHLDMTNHYSIPLNTNLWSANHGFDGVLSPGDSVDLGVLVTFKDDSSLASQPQYDGLNNNMAMGDDMSFDIVVGLEQLTP